MDFCWRRRLNEARRMRGWRTWRALSAGGSKRNRAVRPGFESVGWDAVTSQPTASWLWSFSQARFASASASRASKRRAERGHAINTEATVGPILYSMQSFRLSPQPTESKACLVGAKWVDMVLPKSADDRCFKLLHSADAGQPGSERPIPTDRYAAKQKILCELQCCGAGCTRSPAGSGFWMEAFGSHPPGFADEVRR